MLFLTTLILLHPGHATYTEIEWNAKASCVEVAMRFDAVDEETLLRHLAKVHDCKIAEVTDPMRLEYLVKRFRFDPIDPPARAESIAERYRWIGRETKRADTWWYFEVETASSKRPQRLLNRVLWDVDDRFVHNVRCLGDGKPVTIQFQKDRPVRSLTTPRDEGTNAPPN